MKFFSIIFATVLIYLFAYAPVQAQSFSLQMTPKVYDIVSQRNKTITLPYTITNLGDPQVVTLSVYALSVKDNQGNYDIHYYQQDDNSIIFEIDGETIDLDTPFLLKNKNTLDFDLHITIPETAIESDYLFSLIAEIEPQQGFGNTSSLTIQGGIGSHIVLSVTDSGGLDQKGAIAQYEILQAKSVTLFNKKYVFLNSGDFIPILLIVTNTGTNITKASGSITLIPESYKTRSDHPSFTIPSQYLPAGSQRILKATNNQLCERNENKICEMQHSLVIQAPFFGIYKLAAMISFGESSQISYGNITFITFPFSYLFFACIFILIFIVLLIRFRKKRKTPPVN